MNQHVTFTEPFAVNEIRVSGLADCYEVEPGLFLIALYRKRRCTHDKSQIENELCDTLLIPRDVLATICDAIQNVTGVRPKGELAH